MADPSNRLSSGSSSSSSSSSGAPKGTIFISGYWPPTNIEQPDGMLLQFKSTTRGQLGEYITANYEKSNYQLVTLATEFPGQAGPNYDGGMGFWQVDYMLTSYTFWNLMAKYKPIAVMTTSRLSNGGKVWRLEIGSTNLPQKSWVIPLGGFNTGRPPYIGGSPIDPAFARGLPNAGKMPREGNPPDATLAQNAPLMGVDGVIGKKGLQITIVNDLTKNIPAADLTATQAKAVQGTGLDNYVSAFAGYHAVWYNVWGKTGCKAGWHTHVGSQIDPKIATTAIQRQLLQLIAWLKQQQ